MANPPSRINWLEGLALILMVLVWLGLQVLPSAWMARAFDPHEKAAPRALSHEDGLAILRLTSASRQASERLNLQYGCLAQAISLRWMLRLHGFPAVVRLGAGMAGAKLETHAWVEVGGKAVDNVRQFTPFIPQ
ncbi:lasso peptide biosynthesis B2 protein [bacterium]|nr:lasso peptide biosynthesis B2 protein [bacterium]